MTVLWNQPKAATWKDIGLAVVCRTCNSTIGMPCVDMRQRSLPQTHPSRRDIAEAGLPLNERTLLKMPKQLRGSSTALEGSRAVQ